MKYKMVIYDCDGVIFNSEKANFEYYKYLFQEFDMPELNESDEESMRILHTYSNDKVIEHFATDEESMRRIIEFSRNTDYSMFYPYMSLETGFAETCKKLKKSGIKVGVATNRSYTFENIVKFFKLDELIDDYVTVLDSGVPKPEPDMLLLLMEKNSLGKKDVIFVGDSILDLEAALNADIDFLCYKFRHKGFNLIDSHLEIFKYL